MSHSVAPPPVALTIAGSDPSGGAGLQADLKTFAAHGVYGLSAVTCTTAQIPGRVTAVAPCEPDHLREQIQLLLDAYPIAAAKTGMLFSQPLMEVVVQTLRGRDIPLVVDPVMVASSGDPLLEPDAVDYYRTRLLPPSTLFTPNLDEASVLLGGERITRVDLESSARELCNRYGAAVLLKGGHLCDDRATDILALPDGTSETLEASFIEGVSTHGTGCTYSAAITARLAGGESLVDAVAGAKSYITNAIAESHRWPGGPEALAHFPGS